MQNTNEVTQPAHTHWDHPVFVPAKIVNGAVSWVISKVIYVFSLFIGTCVRIGVFSFGEWQRSWFRNKIIEIYSTGIWALLGNSRWSDERLERSFQVMMNMGGIRQPLTTKDGMTLDSMHIRYENVKRTIEKNGGGQIRRSVPVQLVDGTYKIGWWNANDYVDMIIPQSTDSRWDEFYHDTLQHFKLEKATIQLENGKTVQGFITNHWGTGSSKKPKEGQCFLRCNSPTESFPMSKADIMRRVFLGQDVLCFDYRGTWKSEGHPSEGGYYLDAEAAFEKALTMYKPKDIWIDGFCEGGAVANYLYTKHHASGVNLFVQNPFDRMSTVLKQQAGFAAYGIDGIKSGDPTIEALVEEDGFDNLRKLEKLDGQAKKGCVIAISTDTDRIVGPDSHKNIVAALQKVSAQVFDVIFSPADREKDGHRLDVLADRPTWRKIVSHIAAKRAS